MKSEEQILAENIRKMRKLRKLTLKELAGKVNTSDSYMCEIEKKPKVPNAILFRKIAKALNVKMEKLFE